MLTLPSPCPCHVLQPRAPIISMSGWHELRHADDDVDSRALHNFRIQAGNAKSAEPACQTRHERLGAFGDLGRRRRGAGCLRVSEGRTVGMEDGETCPKSQSQRHRNIRRPVGVGGTVSGQ